MTARDKAPDKQPWPTPWIAVSPSERDPWGFGAVGVHYDPHSPIVRDFGAAFAPRTCELSVGGYQILGPDDAGGYSPVDGWAVVERVPHLLSSLSAGRAALMSTCERMGRFRLKCVIATCSIEDMLTRDSSVPRAARFGSLLSVEMKYGVQVHCVPGDADAEWAAAWFLRRAWWLWLADDASGERLRGVRDAVAHASAGAEVPS